MTEDLEQRFSTHVEFESFLRECLTLSHQTLTMFDPDFAVFPLGSSEIDALLRQFLTGGGQLKLAMHRSATISQQYPRFLRVIKDFSHRVECRITSKSLHHLTDSFCVGDAMHIVRRFHSDHMRGAAAFNAPVATELCSERFAAIWLESTPGLHPTTTGL